MNFKNNFQLFKDHYDKNGWVLLKNFVAVEKINQIKLIIRNFVEDRIKKNNDPRKLNFTDDQFNIKSLNSFHDLGNNKQIKSISNSKKIKDIVKIFLNSEPEYRQSELFAKPKKNGLPSPDHQDNYYWAVKDSNALTIWVALDVSNKENGAVHYYDGSHKFGIMDHKPSYAKGSSQTIKNRGYLKKFNKSQPSLDVGDALIHNCLVVHGSSANKSNKSRQGWTIQFKDKKAKYDLKQKKIYEESLTKQIKKRS
tara:strand:+ start:62 stop:820 length:759 start_codon:yes stop_codon:yes gene_type:complete